MVFHGGFVQVLPLVARSDNHDYPCVGEGFECSAVRVGLGFFDRGHPPAKRHVGHFYIQSLVLLSKHVVQASYDLVGASAPLVIQHLDTEQADLPVDPYDIGRVISDRADSAGDVGPVAFVVHGI